jgi:hypothetical protein
MDKDIFEMRRCVLPSGRRSINSGQEVRTTISTYPKDKNILYISVYESLSSVWSFSIYKDDITDVNFLPDILYMRYSYLYYIALTLSLTFCIVRSYSILAILLLTVLILNMKWVMVLKTTQGNIFIPVTKIYTSLPFIKMLGNEDISIKITTLYLDRNTRILIGILKSLLLIAAVVNIVHTFSMHTLSL